MRGIIMKRAHIFLLVATLISAPLFVSAEELKYDQAGQSEQSGQAGQSVQSEQSGQQQLQLQTQPAQQEGTTNDQSDVNKPSTAQLATTPATELWDMANESYTAAEYKLALEYFLEIEKKGYASWQLFYNIANTYFKLGFNGKAVLYYERALRLNPSERDIQNNLRHAKEFTVDRIEEIPDFILKTWVRDINYKLSSDTWVTFSIVFFIMVALLLLSFRYGPTPGIRKLSFFVSMLLLLAGITATLFAWNQRNAYHKEHEAVIMMPVSTVRSSPDVSGTTLFILHEGTKAQIIEKLGKWVRIELADGRQGWIASEDIELI